ncbi:MAG TPA: hypothetical protein VEF34_18700 [Syntrophobacteraceae bacterium]|nr:hypothetical protein [Syntrophobacteraceae bacterium]
MAEHTQIVSSTPARTRIRVSRKRRNPKEMARLAKALGKSPKVSRVQTNLHAGTLIVHHNEEALADIKAELRDLGVILMAAAGVQTSARSLTDAVFDLDRQLGLATGGLLSLKLLVPAGFTALAVLQLARRGLEIGGAPWYLLAYFAFESFVRLGGPAQQCAPADLNSEKRADTA